MSRPPRQNFNFTIPTQDIIVPSHTSYLLNDLPEPRVMAPIPRRAFRRSKPSPPAVVMPSSVDVFSPAFPLTSSLQASSSITIPTYPTVLGSSHESPGMIPTSTRKVCHHGFGTYNNLYELIGFIHQKRSVPDSPGDHDPYAAPFVREYLGDEKWCIFSARLARPTKVPLKTKGKGSSSPKAFADEEDDLSGTYVIDFLVKNEIVKAVFRALLPWVFKLFTSF